MNVDSRAETGPTKSPEPRVTKTVTIQTNPTTQTNQTLPNAPSNPATTDTKIPDAPRISVSAPEGEDELKFQGPFKAAQTVIRKSRPHPDTDLIKLYGLSALEASVARTDPKTGEKINKLRKSYEGDIKLFNLAGKNRAVTHDKTTDGLSLLEIAQFPPEEFAIQKVSGKEVARGLSESSKSKLERALGLRVEKTPRNAEWENALGLDKRGVPEDTKVKKQEPVKEGTQPSVAPTKTHSFMNGTAPAAAPESNRPKRVGKKRSYKDASFEGYGETFDDDQRDEDSSNEGSKRSSNSRNKRQKSSSNMMSTQGATYASGIVQQPSIVRGIGAYVHPQKQFS